MPLSRHISHLTAFINVRLIISILSLLWSCTGGLFAQNDSIPAMIESNAVINDSVPPLTGTQTLEIRVSPVDIDRDKPQQPIMHFYDRHGNQLQTPVRFLTELDTVKTTRPGPVYPAYNGVSLGLNFFDGLMMAAGQKRASFDIQASVSIFNWVFPTVELGLGFADAYPQDGRSHIKMNPTVYGKVGFDYNFVYKSTPDYKIFLGFRAGLTKFHYSVTGIQAGSDYYESSGGKNLYGIPATVWYGQLLVGLNVKIYRCFSMGWSGRLGFKFKTITPNPEIQPWFIPGYGTGSLSATYSLIFTI